MRIGTLAATGVALLVVAAPAAAQVRVNKQIGRPENFNRVDPKKVGTSNFDRKYMQNAYAANSFEIRVGQLALNRSNDPWVQDYARDMIREHTMAQSELKQLARNKGVALANKWPAMLTRNYRKLSNLRGNSFDNAYRSINLTAHRGVINQCAMEVRTGRDAMVRGYATKVLKAAKDHEMMAMHRETMMVRHNGSYGTAAQGMRP